MRETVLFLVLLTPASFATGEELIRSKVKHQPDSMTSQGAGGQQQVQLEVAQTRRCGYLGRWGSFHLIGDNGSAAYTLGREKYIADLFYFGEDQDYWYFSASEGDPFTSHWAFARLANKFGRYTVWRKDRSGWHCYEATKAWGIGLDGLFGAAAGPSLESRVIDLERRVRNLEQGS